MENNSYSEKLFTHLKDGYQNAQSTIRFIDTKTSIILGLCSTSLTIILTSFLSHPNIIDNIKIITNFQLFFYIITVVSYGIAVALCFIFCLSSLAPRKPPEYHTSILFPFYSNNKGDEHKKYISNFCCEFDFDKLQNEYKEQLYIVGFIISKKVKYNRLAVKAFIVQLAFFLCLLVKYI